MVNDSKNSGSLQSSKESNDLLEGMKRYLRIEHLNDDKELLEYLRKQAGLSWE
jgi:phytoene/squalene synthetase